MKIRILLPWNTEQSFSSPLQKAMALSEVRKDFEASRLRKVLTIHGVNFRLLEHAIFANLRQTTSGCDPEEIYAEILLAFDFPLQIIKENNALVG